MTGPDYQALVHEAAIGWREIKAQSASPLLGRVGLANHVAGVNQLAPAAATEWWPGNRYDTQVLDLLGAGHS